LLLFFRKEESFFLSLGSCMNPFAYDFMMHAYLAATIVSVMAALVGYVLVLRRQSFAGHALGHVGFAGATGALLIGLPALPGLIGTTVLGGMAMGLLGARLGERDVGIGLVLAASLGLGLLFLNFYAGSAAAAVSLLFGNVLGVDAGMLRVLAVAALVTLGLLAVMARPLLFASLQPELAEARGVDLRLVSVVFLGLVGLCVAASAQIVGVLLVFSLLVGPAAAAQRLTHRVVAGCGLAVGLALVESLGGITLAFYTDWPVSFWISGLAVGVYAGVMVGKKTLLF
jgi:zinc/manganese transport system permease protein